MQSRLDEASLRADEAQIEQLKQQAARNGNADGNYNQQLDDWLAAIEKQLGGDDAKAPASNAPNGHNDAQPAGDGASGGGGSSSGQGAESAGNGASGSGGSSNEHGAQSTGDGADGSGGSSNGHGAQSTGDDTDGSDGSSDGNGTQSAGDGASGSDGSSQQGGGASPDSADSSPTSSGPSNTPTQTGANPDSSSGSSTPPDPSQLGPPPSMAASNAQITATAGPAAASTVDQIASSVGQSIGGSAGSGITAWLTGVGANAAAGSQTAGGTAAEAGAAAAAATSEAAEATTIAFGLGGTEAADSIAALAEKYGADVANSVVKSAQKASMIGDPIGETAADLTIQSAEIAAKNAPKGHEGAEAIKAADATARAATVGGLPAAAAVTSVADLGGAVADNVAKAAEAVPGGIFFGGRQAGLAAQNQANAARAAFDLAGGNQSGRADAVQATDLVNDAQSADGIEGAADVAHAVEVGDLPLAKIMDTAVHLDMTHEATSLLDGIIEAGGSIEQAEDALNLMIDVAASNPGQEGIAGAINVASTIQDVLDEGGSINDAMEIGTTVAEFDHNGGPAAIDQAANLVNTLGQQGATPAEQLTALQGAQEATQTDGPAMVNVLRNAAQQSGYEGIETVMDVIEAGEKLELDPAQLTSLASNALQVQQIAGADAATAYLRALNGAGIDGASSVLTAVQNAQANGRDTADIVEAAWDASLDAQKHDLATDQTDPNSGTSSPTLLAQGQGDAGTSPTTTPDVAVDAELGPGFFGAVFLPDYNRLLGDLQSGAGKDTIQADARQLAEDAAKIGYRGTAEIAIDIGTSMNADGSTIGNRDDFINILKQVDPQNSQALQWYAGTSPMYEKYLEFAVEVAGRTDPAKIKQDAQDLAGTAVANGHPSLGNVAISIARSIDGGSYSQDASLNALMNGSVRTPDPAVHGFGNTDTPTLPPPPPQTDDETQAYQKLTDDLNNGAPPDTVITDALALSGIAGDKNDFGTAQAALNTGEAAKAGHLNAANALVDLAMAAPGSDGAKLPPDLQWASSTASKASSAHGTPDSLTGDA